MVKMDNVKVANWGSSSWRIRLKPEFLERRLVSELGLNMSCIVKIQKAINIKAKMI